MDSTANALLRAICEQPDDDTPRLVYADWLEERGDERAELIRVQCEQARLTEENERWYDLKARERQLFAKYRQAWCGDFSQFADAVRFRGGFVDRVALSPQAFLEHGDAMFAAAPVREIVLSHANEDEVLFDVARSPHLGRLRRLAVHQAKLPFSRWSSLLGSPHLTNLTSLDLTGAQLSHAALERLGGATHLRRLRSLRLDNGHVTDEHARILANSPLLRQLEELHLANNYLTAAGIKALASSRYVPARWFVNLTGNHLNDTCVRIAAEGGLWTDARELTLKSSADAEERFTQRTVEYLSDASHLPRLSALTFFQPTSPLLEDVVRSPLIDRLQGLRWDDGIAAERPLGDLRRLSSPRLRRLDFSNGRRGDDIAEAITAPTPTANLCILRLSLCSLTAYGLNALVWSKNLRRLLHLDVSHHSLSDNSVKALANSPYLERLKFLRLSSFERLEASSVRAILNSQRFPNLVGLDLQLYPPDPTLEREALERFGVRSAHGMTGGDSTTFFFHRAARKT